MKRERHWWRFSFSDLINENYLGKPSQSSVISSILAFWLSCLPLVAKSLSYCTHHHPSTSLLDKLKFAPRKSRSCALLQINFASGTIKHISSTYIQIWFVHYPVIARPDQCFHRSTALGRLREAGQSLTRTHHTSPHLTPTAMKDCVLIERRRRTIY